MNESPTYQTRPRTALDRVLRILLGITVTGLSIWMVVFFFDLILYFLLGLLTAYLLTPIVNLFQGFAMGRIPSIIMTFVLVISVLGFVGYLFVPSIAAQAISLTQLLRSGEALNQVADSVQAFLTTFVPIQENAVRNSFDEGFAALFEQQGLTSALTSAANVFANLFYALLIGPLVTFFALKDGLKMREAMLRLVPNRYFEIVLQTIEKIENNLGRYFVGLILQSISVGTLATVLLMVVGVENALAVGIFAGLANTIPYFGPTVGFAAGCIAGISQTGDFSLVPGIFFAMAVTQFADNILLQPFIFSRAAKTHPVVILAVVLMGAQIGGILGMLLAIPVLTVVRVVIEQIIWSLRNYKIFTVWQ